MVQIHRNIAKKKYVCDLTNQTINKGDLYFWLCFLLKDNQNEPDKKVYKRYRIKGSFYNTLSYFDKINLYFYINNQRAVTQVFSSKANLREFHNYSTMETKRRVERFKFLTTVLPTWKNMVLPELLYNINDKVGFMIPKYERNAFGSSHAIGVILDTFNHPEGNSYAIAVDKEIITVPEDLIYKLSKKAKPVKC